MAPSCHASTAGMLLHACRIARCARWQQPTAVVSLQPRVVDNCWGISATVSLLTLMWVLLLEPLGSLPLRVLQRQLVWPRRCVLCKASSRISNLQRLASQASL